MALKFADLSKIPPKQKAIVAVLVCLLAGVGYYYMFYRAASAEMATLGGQLSQLESKIKEQEVIARNLPSFRAEVQRLETQLGLLLDQLPNSAEIPSLLRNITDLGRESTLEFVRFTPSPESKREFYAEIPVAISVNGEYHGFARFVDRVSHLPRIVNISNIAFSQPKRVGDDRISVNVSCTATTYRFLEQESKAAAGNEKPK